MSREWFEEESFWIDLYPLIFPEHAFTDAERDIDLILKLADFREGAVLDLCCGPGRHSVILAAKGIQVTGVDRTKFLLAKAKALAAARKVRVEWVRQDMREFVRHEAFDLVLNLFTSFGFFHNKDDDRKVLSNIYACLKPGGCFLIDVVSKEWIARVFEATTSRKSADGTLLVERHAIIDDWTRMHNEWIIVSDNKAKKYVFHHTIYSGQELKDRMIQAGFREVRLYGDLKGSEYGFQAERLVAVARK
jgi:SAM-dependent methyltransferase